MRLELLGLECRCSNTKKGGMSLCHVCWFRLPRDLQRSLYKLIGAGYQAAYTAACKWLDEDAMPPRVIGKVP
jgi:hypothetical protein